MKDYVALARQYESDVLDGTIPACKQVKQACQRNRNDLAKQGARGFPYRFDEKVARRICEAAELLPHIKGPEAKVIGRDEEDRPVWNPIRLEPWQCWLLTTLFGWSQIDTGRRRFKVALILVPRKNAKSTLAAIVALYMLTADGESGAECYSAATTRDQAKVVAEIAWEMSRRSPEFTKHFGVKVGAKTTRVLEVPATASKFMPLSADAHTLDGLNVSCAVIDELHAHPTRGVWDVIDTATGARNNPLILAITTAGVDIGGICHEKMSYLHKVLEGTQQDETFFGINYTVDSEPHADKIQASKALRGLDSLCNCGRVDHTLIARFWREACVRLATTNSIHSLTLADVRSILTERLEPEACAVPATTSGVSIETQTTNADAHSELSSGAGETKTRSRQPTRDTEARPKTEKKSSTVSDSKSTELHAKNTIGSEKASEVSALSANSHQRDVFTWITATATELFGASFAINATARSAFSETLRNAYDAHSNTCKARQSAKLNSHELTIEYPPDDWRLEATWRKANPNYGVSVSAEDLDRKAREAQSSSAAVNNFLTKHLNVWVRSESTWLPAEHWLKNGDVSRTIDQFASYPCWIGVDLAEVRDIAAVVIVFRLAEDRYMVFGRYYLPEVTVSKSPVAQMSGFVRGNYLIQTDGDQSDYQRIEDDIAEWCKTYRVQKVCFDRALAAQMSQSLQRRFGGSPPLETVPQGPEVMTPAMQTVERLILSGGLQHDANPCLTWMMSNVVTKPNHRGEIYPMKAGGKDSPNKIDGPVALFTAMSQAVREVVKPQMFFLGAAR